MADDAPYDALPRGGRVTRVDAFLPAGPAGGSRGRVDPYSPDGVEATGTSAAGMSRRAGERSGTAAPHALAA